MATPLFCAVVSGNLDTIHILLENGVNVNAINDHGLTPLHLAALKNAVDILDVLIQHGADRHIVARKFTPLHIAVAKGHLEVVKYFLKLGYSHENEAFNDMSLLQLAANSCKVDVIMELLDSNVIQDYTPSMVRGITPLHVLAAHGKTEYALKLINHNPFEAIVVGIAGTPLHQAAIGGHSATFEALLSYQYPIGKPASNGATVLHFAARSGNIHMIEKLLHSYVDVNATDYRGMTPLHIAAANGHPLAVFVLFMHGASPEVASCDGTPIELTSKHQNCGVGCCIYKNSNLADKDFPQQSNVEDFFAVLRLPVTNLDQCCSEVKAEANTKPSLRHSVVIRIIHYFSGVIQARNKSSKSIAHKRTPSLSKETHTAYGEQKIPAKHHIKEESDTNEKQFTPVLMAAGMGFQNFVAEIVNRGCDVDATVEIVNRGCDVDATNEDNMTLLHLTATTGNTEAAVELIKHGASKDIVAGTLGTPLHQAAAGGHLTTLRALLEHGCSLNTLATNGCTVLHHGASGGNVEVIQELVNRKCNVDATDEVNCTPLHSAAANGKTEAAIELIKHGASKDIVAGTLGTPLHEAAVGGHLTTLRALLEHGCSLDTLTTNGRTVLHAAASGGNVTIIQELISRKCNVDATDENNLIPIHFAAAKGSTEAAVELIRHGASKDIVAGPLGTPLHQAAVGGHLTTLRALLEHGCSLDTLTTNGHTVLHRAAVGGNVTIIQELISKKCDIDATDERKWTPLHSAAANGKTEAAIELIKHGAFKDIVAGPLGTPLHQAAFYGHLTTLKALLEYGCLLDTLSTNGHTVLHHAASGGSVEVIQELISRKCDVDATDEDNWTPLHSAASRGKTEVALELIKHGADLHVVSGINGTPFNLACFGGHMDTVKALSQSFSDVIHSKASICATSLHAAAQGNNPEIVRFLINSGLQVNSSDVYGFSPLHYAAGFGGLESYQVLVDNGANEQCMAPGFLTPLMFAQMTSNKRITEYFKNSLQPFDTLINLCQCQNFGNTIGASSLEYFFALNLIKEGDSDGQSKTKECQQSINLLKKNLSSVNIHNIIAIGALLGSDGLIDVIDTVLQDNPTVINNTDVSTVTVDSVKWIFQLSKTEPIFNTTLIPGKTLSPLHLAMIAEKFSRRRSHLVLHVAPHKHLNFINKLLSTPYLRQVYCGSQSSNWPIHPMHLADLLHLYSFSDPLHEAGLGQFLLPLEANSPFTHGPIISDIASLQKYLDCELRKPFEQKPQKNLLMKHIVNKVRHRYDDDDLEKLTISLDITSLEFSEASAMSSKTFMGLLVFWLKNSQQPTWNQLLEVLDDFETANTMKTMKKELREELTQVKMFNSSQTLLSVFDSRPSQQPHSYMPVESFNSSGSMPYSNQFVIEINHQSTSSNVMAAYSVPDGGSIPHSVTLQTDPSEKQLCIMVIPEVCSEWYNFGLYLGMKANSLDEIQARGLPPHGCCTEAVKHWLKYLCGSGQKRRSWNTVLVAVTKVRGEFLTKKIIKQVGLQSAKLTYDDFTHTRFTDLNIEPELVELVEFVVDKVEGDFHAFAISLGISLIKIESIRQDYPFNLAHCCREALKYWLSGKGGTDVHKPRTWHTVLEAVSASVGPEVSKGIIKDLLLESTF